MKKTFRVLAVSSLQGLAFHAFCQSSHYLAEARQLKATIHHYFYIDSSAYYKETVVPEKDSRAVSFLWPLCAMMQADNELEKLDSTEALLVPVFRIIRKYHNELPPAPGYASYAMPYGGGDRFFDDNQWIGIAAMDAFQRTGNPQWLQTGKEIYRFMMTAYDSVAGGGLYWQEGNLKTKNTCSNGPGIILAMQLYQATNERSYLDTALLLYHWVNAKLRSPEGLYYDNINLVRHTVDKRLYSYNTGTMLQSAVYLFEATGDKKYLQQATAIADSSVKQFLPQGHFTDAYWFHAVLLRGYQHLLKHNRDRKYLRAFETCVDNALADNKDEKGLMGKVHTLNLVSQGGMLEVLARLAFLESHSNR